MKKIIIIGAGPTGLAAAYRLKELGYDNFKVYEQKSYAGGLCASFRDEKGFIWDLGGHVLFSHYAYFDKLLKKSLKNDLLEHKREAWVRIMNRWVPYPFQNNLRYLPRDVILECIEGLKNSNKEGMKSVNFEEWIINNMGKGIARHFMVPYNFKTWAYPANLLSADWIAERVSKIKLKDVLAHMRKGTDKTDWGPNAVFKYPLYGGTGEVFRRLLVSLKDKVATGKEVVKINTRLKRIYFSRGREDVYDILINTAPLDKFLRLSEGCGKDLLKASLNLKHNGVFVVGLGINKSIHTRKCWMYFPETNSPFFRATYLSNYSPNNIPGKGKYYSLLCETAYSKHRKENKTAIVEKTIDGLINSRLINKNDRKSIVSTFLFDIEYAYPVPTLKRDDALRSIQPRLEEMDIYSRGRFGAWKYEVGNTDYSVMQGKEVIDRILKKKKEKVWTL